MSRSPDRLYALLPAVHRMRDAELNYPLRALLRVINEQVDVVEDDIAQLYENWFIETCEDWVLPYIGELIGYAPVNGAGSGSQPGRDGRNRVLFPRGDVARTLGFRRRKGTLALLEELSAQAAGWPARAVEFYTLLGWRQHVSHARPSRGRGIDVRNGDLLDLLGGPFDAAAHTVDMRRMTSPRKPGRYNLANVAVHVWRLKACSVTHAPAYCLGGARAQCFTFSALGHDTALYAKATPETDPTQIAAEFNRPVPMRRRALERIIRRHPRQTEASAALYGEQKSLVVYAPGWAGNALGVGRPVPASSVIAADLSDWRYRAPPGQIAVDPVLGRIVFPVGQLPRLGVWVSYHYGFSADMGAGEYPRTLSQPMAFMLYPVSKDHPGGGAVDSIDAALGKWRADQQALGPAPAGGEDKARWDAARERLRAAVIEIRDSAAYGDPVVIALEAGESLQLRAANRTRPVILLRGFNAGDADALRVSGKRGSRFTLDGVVVAGRAMQIAGPDRSDAQRVAEGDLCDVTLRHVTLVPGWNVECGCPPRQPGETSLQLFHTGARVVIEHSIVGAIAVVADERRTDPLDIVIADSIVDATGESGVAVGGADRSQAFANLTVLRSTLMGALNTHAIAVAENAIFMGPVTVARRQQGCLRYCYVTPGARTPRRYRCQPETAEQAAIEVLRESAKAEDVAPPDDAAVAATAERARDRVRPRFTSTRYGHSAYCQLACDCADEIRRGADDEAEMGAFHDLYQPQREANLRARLDEYAPAGMAAGILFAD